MEETIIISVFLAVVLVFGSIFYLLGKNALKMFPDISTVTIVFREKNASGYSNNSIISKAGGAAGVLDVVLTTEELWLKTGVFFSLIAKMYNVLHKINRKNFIKVEKVSRRKVLVFFKDEKGNERSLTLKLKNADAFMDVLRKKKLSE